MQTYSQPEGNAFCARLRQSPFWRRRAPQGSGRGSGGQGGLREGRAPTAVIPPRASIIHPTPRAARRALRATCGPLRPQRSGQLRDSARFPPPGTARGTAALQLRARARS